MSTPVIGAIAFGIMILLLTLGVPVAFSMAVVAFGGFVVVNGWSAAMGMLATSPYSTVADYIMTTLPLFVLMGDITFRAGIVSDAFSVANKWLGKLPGGLAIATITGCAGFATCTGSSAASVGFMTMSTLPEMDKYGYNHKLSTGTIASGASLGVLIPPSLPLIIYGLFAGESVAQLFMAGIIPGIMLMFLFMAVVVIWVKMRPQDGPQGPSVSWKERVFALREVWALALLATLIIVGIWTGFFTPIEAGGIGSAGALVLALARRKLTWKTMFMALKDTASITGLIFTILIGSIMLNYFLATTRLPTEIAGAIASANLSPIIVLWIIVGFYIIGGALMDSLGLMLLTMPILIPIVRELGVDMISYGILMVMMINMAQITPPVGMNVFIVSGIAKHVPMYDIFKGVTPFFIAMLLLVALIIFFPQISTILPDMMASG